jgi:transcriptional regulator with XRE-family HTH domain
LEREFGKLGKRRRKQSSLSDIEADRSKPREATLLALARALNHDFGEEWIRRRLSQTTDWERELEPVLWMIQSREPYLYLFVARLAEANERFRQMLKPEELQTVLKARNEFVHLLHVEIPPKEQERRRAVVAKIQSSIESAVQDLGSVDDFDIAAAVEKYDNALLVLRDWYAHDNVAIALPQTLDFQGWETYTLEKKVQEIKAAREIMDHNRYLEERLENSHRIKGSK